MHCWQKVLPKSITGLPIPAGSRSRCEDFGNTLWLVRLSYLRYLFKAAAEPRKVFEQESEELRLSSRLFSTVDFRFAQA
jgi:hypothetical protein